MSFRIHNNKHSLQTIFQISNVGGFFSVSLFFYFYSIRFFFLRTDIPSRFFYPGTNWTTASSGECGGVRATVYKRNEHVIKKKIRAFQKQCDKKSYKVVSMSIQRTPPGLVTSTLKSGPIILSSIRSIISAICHSGGAPRNFLREGGYGVWGGLAAKYLHSEILQFSSIRFQY